MDSKILGLTILSMKNGRIRGLTNEHYITYIIFIQKRNTEHTHIHTSTNDNNNNDNNTSNSDTNDDTTTSNTTTSNTTSTYS